jgi:uncharacterized protein (TIGR03084 family)
VRDIVTALLAESAALDGLVADLPADAWSTPTPAEGWDVKDSVAHIAMGNELAEECARTGRSTMIEDVLAAGSFAEFEAEQVARGRAMSPAEVLQWWRSSTRALAEVLLTKDPRDRLPWGPNVMSATSFTTARLMETWAHGLDCFDGLGVPAVDTERLWHVAHLGWRTLGFAFALKGLPAPAPVRLVLTAPDASTWTLGDDGAPNVVRGSAGDWCRVVTHRDRKDEKAHLQATGPDGDTIVANAQAFLSA